MKRLLKLVTLLMLCVSMPLVANVALPSLYEALGFSVRANGITLLGFSLELLCVCIMVRISTIRLFGEALYCTVAMNAFSAIIGLVARIPLFLLISYIAQSLFGQMFRESILGYGFIMLFVFVTLNTLLEGFIARNLFFPKVPVTRFWFWIMMANLLSNGTGLWLANSYFKVF